MELKELLRTPLSSGLTLGFGVMLNFPTRKKLPQRLHERCAIYPFPLTLSHLVCQSNVKFSLSRFRMVKEFLWKIHNEIK